jgi:4'-phosphopantetheinyl transferase
VPEPLPECEPHLYWLDPVELAADADAARRGWSWLDAEERERHARIACERQRGEFLAAHALLRASLSRHAATAPGGWRFVRDAHGRPGLAAEHGGAGLRFSLSHTAGLVAVAVARARAVGVDAEDLERAVDGPLVARRFFAPSEVAALAAAPTEPLRRERFFALWTLKEAYLKARGLGLALSLADAAFSLDDDAGGALESAGADGGGWQFARFRPTARHRIAACVARGAGERACTWVARGVSPATLGAAAPAPP